ncbi:hypothetical protein EXN66_Car009923 [Channa argus]|uniref:Uncharacterized protein n=1 Tax=Channa argus TaxID=215402 RepID=A0A6G1PVI2_CHAAH|nr:hypothetical protein EXN66_Car009923 [Channa argus]
MIHNMPEGKVRTRGCILDVKWWLNDGMICFQVFLFELHIQPRMAQNDMCGSRKWTTAFGKEADAQNCF